MSTNHDLVRIVLLSGVRHAKEYAHLLATRDGVAVVAVWEDPTAAPWMVADSRRLAAELGVPLVCTGEPPGLEDFDVAVVCSEPTRHAALADMALDTGLDVLVDKPVSTNAQAAHALADKAARLGKTLTVVSRVGTAATQRARAAIDAGQIGMPRHVDIEFLASGAHFATSVERPELVVNRDLSGGGEVMNFMGYAVDAIRYLSGCEITEIHCETATLFSDVHRAAGVEDVGIASLALTNGVTATITVGRVPSAPSSGPNASSIRVLGSHGHLSIDDERPSVRQFHTDGTSTTTVVGGGAVAAALTWTFEDFLTARATGRSPAYTAKDAAAAIEVISAAYNSAETGQPVRLGALPQPSNRSELGGLS